MTTPTSALGWLKPDPGDPVDINVINAVYDDFDADARTYYLSKLPIVPTMGKYKFSGLKYTCTNSVKLLNATTDSSYRWERLWHVESNLDSFSDEAGGHFAFTNGNLMFFKNGIYRVIYNIVVAATGTTAVGFEGWAKAALYKRSGTVLVPGTETTERRVFTTAGYFQHLHKSNLLVVDNSSNILTFTDYSLGINTSSSAGTSTTITTEFAAATPYETTCTVEFVRGL